MRNNSIFNNSDNRKYRSIIKVETKKETDKNLVLTHLSSEKEFYTNEVSKTEKELMSLTADYVKYVNKTKDRESELRTHISSLSEKIRIKDIGKVKSAMNELQRQIIDNISEIENLKRKEINKKKTDIENRINLRIMDSEFRFKNILSKKLDEQDNMLRSLVEYTKEMEKIRENYENIRKKSENLSKENKGCRTNIKELELKNSKIKIELTNLKKYFNYVCLKIQKNGKLDDSNHNPLYLSQNNTKDHTDNDPKEKISQNNPFSVQADLVTIKNLLQNENFIKNYPRSSSIISSLANILENLKLRINKSKSEFEIMTNTNKLQEKVIELTKPFKLKTFNNTFNNFPKRNSFIDTNNLKNQVALNKELREDLIDSLIKDPDIINMVYGEKIPDSILFKKRLLLN